MHLLFTNGLAVAGPGSFGGELWQGLLGDWRALAWLAALQVAFILAAWLASLALVPRLQLNNFAQYDSRPGGSLSRAFSLYLLYLVIAAGLIVALKASTLEFKLSFLTAVSAPWQLPPKWAAIFAGLALLCLVLGLSLPIAIFRIRVGRALALLLVTLLATAGAGWALNRPLGFPVQKRLAAISTWAESKRAPGKGVVESIVSEAKENIAFAAAEKTASNPAKSLDERKAAVRTMYTQLEEIRGELKDGDTAGRAEYDRKMARYTELLRAVRAELAKAAPQ